MLAHWQNLIAVLLVIGAAVYVAWRFIRGSGNGCGGCAGCSEDLSTSHRVPIVPLQNIKIDDVDDSE